MLNATDNNIELHLFTVYLIVLGKEYYHTEGRSVVSKGI